MINMKRIKKISLSLSLSFVLASSSLFSISGFADDYSRADYQLQIKNYKKSYNWRYDSHDEKIDLLQIPTDSLKNMSTDELIESVKNYPLYMDMFAFESYSEGFESLLGSFNGLSELVNRQDAYSKLNKLRKELYSSDSLKSTYIKSIINHVETQYSPNRKNGFEKKYSIDFNYVPTATLHTPNGTGVDALIRGELLSSDDINEINNYVSETYPNAVLLAPPTSEYNCHSYAWYSQYPGNVFWINDPTPYMTDGSYHISPGMIGDKVYYSEVGNEHSGIVSGGSAANNYDNLIVTSKWGNWGLMRHEAKDSPYFVDGLKLQFYNNN